MLIFYIKGLKSLFDVEIRFLLGIGQKEDICYAGIIVLNNY